MAAASQATRTGDERSSWLRMEFRHLAALAAVESEGSFVDAAFELGYVQSAVSQQIAHLEGIVGARLVDRQRGASPVALTEAGKLLLRHFEGIRTELEEARADLDAAAARSTSLLRVGVWDAIATHLVPAVLRSLARRCPDVDVQLECDRRPLPLAEGVKDGRLELAFGVLPLPLPIGPLSFEPLLEDPYVLVVPESWPIAARETPVGPDEIRDLRLVATGDEVVATALSQSLEGVGAEPAYVAAAEGDGAVQAVTSAGIGAAILPRMSVDLKEDRIVSLDLDEVIPPRQIVLYRRSGAETSTAAEAFIDAASRVCGRGSSHPHPSPALQAA